MRRLHKKDRWFLYATPWLTPQGLIALPSSPAEGNDCLFLATCGVTRKCRLHETGVKDGEKRRQEAVRKRQKSAVRNGKGEMCFWRRRKEKCNDDDDVLRPKWMARMASLKIRRDTTWGETLN